MRPIHASGVKTKRGCFRRWGFDRLRAQGNEEESQAMSDGTECHLHAERWLRDHEPPPDTKTGDIITEGLHHLPLPGTVWVEQQFDMVWKGTAYQGTADFGSWCGVALGDHKTTSDLKWAKTESELELDPQWIIYSAWLATVAPHHARYYGMWIYYQRRKPYKTKAVHLSATREEVIARMDHLNDTDGADIVRAWAAPNFDDLPRSTEYCYAYNKPCPYMQECWKGRPVMERFTLIGAKTK